MITSKIEKQRLKLMNMLTQLEYLESIGNRLHEESYEQELFSKYVTEAENFALEAREFVPLQYRREADLYRKNGSDVSEISAEKCGDVITIVIPRLLPHRTKQSASTKAYFYKTFGPALHEALRSMTVFEEKVVIWYEHMHSNHNELRDFDNIETKYITDIIAPYVVKDDNPNWISVYHSGRETKKQAYTRIRIMPERIFLERRWMNETDF